MHDLKSVSKSSFFKIIKQDLSVIRQISAFILNCPIQWEGMPRQLALHQIFWVERGGVFAKWDRTETYLGPGDVAWVPCHAHRFYKNDPKAGPSITHRCLFNVVQAKTVLNWHKDPIVRRDGHALSGYFQLLRSLAPDRVEKLGSLGRLTPATAVQCQSLVLALLHGFMALPGADPANGKGETGLQPDQRRVLEAYIDAQAPRGITVADLASVTQLSHDYFSRQFSKTYCLSPRDYIKGRRMQRVAELLAETRLSLKDIAGLCEHHNVALLCKQFKSVQGVTPSQFRRQAH